MDQTKVVPTGGHRLSWKLTAGLLAFLAIGLSLRLVLPSGPSISAGSPKIDSLPLPPSKQDVVLILPDSPDFEKPLPILDLGAPNANANSSKATLPLPLPTPPNIAPTANVVFPSPARHAIPNPAANAPAMATPGIVERSIDVVIPTMNPQPVVSAGSNPAILSEIAAPIMKVAGASPAGPKEIRTRVDSPLQESTAGQFPREPATEPAVKSAATPAFLTPGSGDVPHPRAIKDQVVDGQQLRQLIIERSGIQARPLASRSPLAPGKLKAADARYLQLLQPAGGAAIRQTAALQNAVPPMSKPGPEASDLPLRRPAPPLAVPLPTNSANIGKLNPPAGSPALPIPAPGKGSPTNVKPNDGDSLVDPPNAPSLLPGLAPTVPRGKPLVEVEEDEKIIERRAIVLGSARNSVRAGQFKQAMALFEQYLKDFPRDLEIREEYAGVLVQAGQIDSALANYEIIIKAKPNMASRLRVEIGNIYVNRHDYPRAISQYQIALRLELTSRDSKTHSKVREIAILLARAYAFDDDVWSALEIYHEYLADLMVEDITAPRLLGALLLDLDQPAAAKNFLLAYHLRQPHDGEILAYLIEAHVKIEEILEATQRLELLVAEAQGKLDSLLMLAMNLVNAEETDFAISVYCKILELNPQHALARIGLANAQIMEYRLRAGFENLQRAMPTDDSRRAYLLTGGRYFVRTGEYADAKALYRVLLDADPFDAEARLGLAGVYEFTKDYELAKAEFSKVSGRPRDEIKAKVGILRVLTLQHQHPQALQYLTCFNPQEARHGIVISQIADSLIKAKQPVEAIQLLREYIARAVTDSTKAQGYVSLGRAQVAARRYADAILTFDVALGFRAGRVLAAFYGRSQAVNKGTVGDVAALYAGAINSRGGRLLNYLGLADFFSADGDDARVVQLCTLALEIDPDNLAALVRKIEAEQRVARQTNQIHDVVSDCQRTIEISPTNFRAWISLARSHGSHKDYPLAAAQYDRLISFDPDFSIPHREKARVLYSNNDFESSHNAYASAIQPSADARLRQEVETIGQGAIDIRPTLEAYLAAKTPGDELAKKVAALFPGLAGSACHSLLQYALLDYNARRVVEAEFALEDEAKENKGLRNFAAIPLYRRLLCMEPDNTEASFDLGQTYADLKFTTSAQEFYSKTLDVDRQHRDATIASDRAFHETNVQLHQSFFAEYEQGRNNLASILRLKYGDLVRWPIGDENEYLGIGFYRANYHPRDDRSLSGNILSAHYQQRVWDNTYLFALLNYEQYPDRLTSRPTFDIGGYAANDYWKIRLEAMLENVVLNGESLRQDIWRIGARGTANYRANRRLDFSGMIGGWNYSDNNLMSEGNLTANYLISFVPHQLKAVLLFDFNNFQRQTQITSGQIDDIRNAVHPYFSPRDYYIYQARLEWTQYLSRDYFTHSNVCWYSLQYGVAWDSFFTNYHLLRAMLNKDVCSWMTLTLDSRVTLSQPYQGAGLYAFMILRWPLAQNCCD